MELRPGVHSWQAVLPGLSLKCPDGHSLHRVVALLSWSYDPAAQTTQSSPLRAPAAPYVPVGQAPSQLSAPVPAVKEIILDPRVDTAANALEETARARSSAHLGVSPAWASSRHISC